MHDARPDGISSTLYVRVSQIIQNDTQDVFHPGFRQDFHTMVRQMPLAIWSDYHPRSSHRRVDSAIKYAHGFRAVHPLRRVMGLLARRAELARPLLTDVNKLTKSCNKSARLCRLTKLSKAQRHGLHICRIARPFHDLPSTPQEVDLD